MKADRILAVAMMLLMATTLSGCTLSNVAARQEEATGLWEELVRGESFGQSFECTRDNLYRVDLGTATYARINSAPVIFHLRSQRPAGTDILSVTLPGPEIQNERPTAIEFPPLADSEGKTYYFYIESPEAVPGNAVTVYANAYDQYPDGSAYRNGGAVAGDLVFTAYTRETFSPSDVLDEFLSRVAQDMWFFVFWGFLVAGAIAGLVTFGRRRESTSGPEDAAGGDGA